MAGDWIKVEVATLDKPEVVRMAELLGVKRDEMLGILLRFWAWLDRSTGHGVVTHVSRLGLDDVLHVSGFSAALECVGWGFFDKEAVTLTVPNFDAHNGNPAKTRGLAQKRKRNERSRSCHDESVTREEKRRDISTTDVVDIKRNALLEDVDPRIAKDWQAMRKQKKAAVTQTAIDGIRSEAKKAGISLNDALALCCQRGWTGFKAEWVGEARAGMSHKDAERKKFFDSIHGHHANEPIDITPISVD